MTDNKNRASLCGSLIGARDRPYNYRPHSPPSNRNGAVENKSTALIYIAVLVALLALIGFILFGFFSSHFNIGSVSILGTGEHSEEQILAAAKIDISKKLYSLNCKEIERNILLSFPQIAEVNVTKKLPSELRIELFYDAPKYFISVSGEYFTLSENLRVLDRTSNKKDQESKGLIYVSMPDVKRAVAGEALEFFNEDSEYIKRFLSIFSESDFCGDVDRIYIDGKFDISLVKTGKYRIEMGDFKDEALKLKMAEKVLENGGYRDLSGVVLNVSDVSESSVMVYKTLEIE